MKQPRPRSADLGGLHLATAGSGLGQGWLGHSCELQTRFAELLSDMYNETLNAVNEHNAEFAPTDLPLETRIRLIQSLDSWNFEPHKLPDEEVLSCTMILFEALFHIEGMKSLVGVSLNQIYPLIHHLRRIYRWENPYHNFEHALDVLQATYTFLRLAGMVPSVTILLDDEATTWSTAHSFDSGQLMTTLRPQDLFVLYIAAIGHDVAHPGFTNVFMKNAKAPLSVVFDKSPLERMHMSLLLRVMRHHGLGPLLDDPADNSGQRVRTLLSETVLATDMSVHGAFMDNFRSLSSGTSDADLGRRQVLMCQAIIKCADISNPYRPYHVAKHWAAALMGEWSSQAMLEECMHLPPTVQASDDPLIEAKGQLFFINTFAKPLLELVVESVPELDQLLDQCKSNLSVWESRRTELEGQLATDNEKDATDSSRSTTSTPYRDDYSTAFPLTLPAFHPYRNLLHIQPRVSLEQLNSGQTETTEDTGSSSGYGEEQPPCGTTPLSMTAVSDTFTGITLNWASGVNGTKDDQAAPSSSESDSIPCSPSSDGSSEYGSCLDSPARSLVFATSTPSTSASSHKPPTTAAPYTRSSQSRSRTSSAMSSASSYETGISSPPRNVSTTNGTHTGYDHHSKNGHRSRDSTCSSTTSRETYTAHAAIRAAADSAAAGLRKKRSMANRNSWGPSMLVPKEELDGGLRKGLFATSKPLGLPVSLPPPPISPARLNNGSSVVVGPDTVAVFSTDNTPVAKRKTTIVVSQPQPVAKSGV